MLRYIVDRGDQELWDKVLADDNKARRQLIDQVGRTACSAATAAVAQQTLCLAAVLFI